MRALALVGALGVASCAHQPPAPTPAVVCETKSAAAPVPAPPPAMKAEQAFERANRSVLDIDAEHGVPATSLQAVRQLHENAAHARDVAVAHPRSPHAAAKAVEAASALDHFIAIVKRHGQSKRWPEAK